MEIGYFSNFSAKYWKVIKTNALTLLSIHCFKSFLILFLSFSFYYTIMKLIMKVKLFSFLIFLRHQTLFFIHFNIFAVYLLYRIRLTWLSIDIELNSGPKQSSFKYFSTCLRNHSHFKTITLLKIPYTIHFTDIQRINLVILWFLKVYIKKVCFLNRCSTIKWTNLEKQSENYD